MGFFPLDNCHRIEIFNEPKVFNQEEHSSATTFPNENPA